MFHCPRCKHILPPHSHQCDKCGEILLDSDRTKNEGSADVGKAVRAAKDAEDRAAEALLRAMPAPFQLHTMAKFWMALCLVCALISAFFAFKADEEIYILSAFFFIGLTFLPVLIVIFGHIFGMALIARRELTYVAFGLMGLAGLIAIGWGISQSGMSMNFTGLTELLRDQHFVKVLITLLIMAGVVAIAVPLAKAAMQKQSTGTVVEGFKAESAREMGLKFNENDTELKLRSIDMQHEVEMRRLELEEKRIQIKARQLELKAEAGRILIEDKTGTSTDRHNWKNRMVPCRECGEAAFFSDANRSSDLCDEHNLTFKAAFRKCSNCNLALPRKEFTDDSSMCNACRGKIGEDVLV